MSNLLQWAIIAFVVLSILYHVWKGGRANPQSTGTLSRELGVVKAVAADAAKAATRLEKEMKERDHKVDELFDCLRKIERDASARHATMDEVAADVRSIGTELDTLQKDAMQRLATVEATTRTTAGQVDRLYDIIVTKGMS